MIARVMHASIPARRNTVVRSNIFFAINTSLDSESRMKRPEIVGRFLVSFVHHQVHCMEEHESVHAGVAHIQVRHRVNPPCALIIAE